MNQSKLTDLTVENILFTNESVKMQITDSISEILSNSALEGNQTFRLCSEPSSVLYFGSKKYT